MKTIPINRLFVLKLCALVIGLWMTIIPSSGQVTTNWIAFNDHRPGANTSPNATDYDMLATAAPAAFKDFNTGLDLPAMLEVVANGAPDNFGANAYFNPGTPAYNLFNGAVETGNDGIVGVRASSGTTVTLIFTNLNPNKLYVVKGSVSRGNNYADRWGMFTIQGADNFVDAHVDGSTNRNIFTAATFPNGTLTNGQVALNGGENRVGSIVSWTEIQPGADGAFSILAQQYTGRAPFGTPAAGPYGYALNCLFVAEIESSAPRINQNPSSLAVGAGQAATFSVGVSGTGSFQWQKASAGSTNFTDIAGATAATYTTPVTTVADNGAKYRVRVTSGATTLTSQEATLTVDDTSPTVLSVTGSPTFNKVTVVFSEPVSAATATNRGNYTIQGLTISEARLAADGSNVVLITSTQTTGTVYNVTIRDVRDNLAVGAHTISPNPTTKTFTGWVLATGGVLHNYWNGITPNAVASLTADLRFPNDPSFSTVEPRFEYPPDGGNEAGSNYGNQLSGWLVPPVTGDYIFYVCSDDPSELWLSTDANPANKQQIATEPQWNSARQWVVTDRRSDPPENRSLPIRLVAGNRYYIETLHTEGGGGDNVGVAWQLPGAQPPANGDAPIDGRFVMTYINPDALNLTITQQPANLTAPANGPALFSVRYTAQSDFGTNAAIQWQKAAAGSSAFTDIPGATGTDYLIPFVSAADNGAKYRAVLTLGILSRTSSEAALTVGPDTTKPSLVAASAAGSTALITFSEPVDQATATATANYSINNGVTVSGASLVADPAGARVVALTINGTAPGAIYTVTVNNVRDRASNVINANSQVSFAVANVLFDFNNGATPTGTSLVAPAVVQATGGVNNSGVLQLTSSAGDQNGAFFVNDLNNGAAVRGFVANFKLFIGNGSANAADGFSFNFASGLADGVLGEEGAGNGLTLTFDTYDNGGSEAPAIDVKFGGNVIASRKVSKATLVNGRFVDVFVEMGPDGALDLVYDGQPYYVRLPIPGWTPVTGGRFGLGARTGGEFATHRVDDLSILTLTGTAEPPATITITRQPENAVIVENTSATFTVAATGSNPAFTYQWQKASATGSFADIAGATNATLVTAPIPSAENGSKYRVIITARGGTTATSAEATVTLQADTQPPTVVSAERDIIDTRKVRVIFSERMLPSSITAGAFSINNGISVSGAALNADGVTAILTTSAIANGTTNTVTINGVKDVAGNTIAAGTQKVIVIGVPRILFIAASTTPAVGSADFAVLAKLQNRDYQVTLRTGAAATAQDAVGKDLILISATVAAADVNTKFRDVALPIINWSPALQADLQMTGPTDTVDFGTVGGQTQLDIVRTNHPMAGGLDLGSYIVAGGGGQTLGWGLPSTNAVVIATITGVPEQAAIYVYEKGSKLINNSLAPDKRIMYYYNTGAAGSQAGEASRLFDATLDYALGITGGPVIQPDIRLTVSRSGNQVVIGWTPATGTLQSSTRVDGGWQDEPAGPNPRTFAITGGAKFFRVRP